jgi:uncharacterized membrane protein
MAGTFFPGIEHLQNIHPLLVHFPLAFLPGAFLFYLMALFVRRDFLATTAFNLLLLGAVAAFAAVWSGLYAEPGVMIARSVRARLLHDHKEQMLLAMGFAIVLATWAALDPPFPQKGRSVFLILFLFLLGFLALGADSGGRLVFDYNAGGNACPQPIEFTR